MNLRETLDSLAPNDPASPLQTSNGPASFRLLLIEDDEEDAFFIREILDQADSVRAARGTFKLVHVTALAAGLAALDQHPFDIILLDLCLPDSNGLGSLRQLRAKAAGIPVVILSGYDDESVAREAVRNGAQDYLVKGQFDFKWLSHIMLYAIERKQADVDVKERELMGRKSVQKILTQQTELLKSFLDSVADGLVVSDATGRVVRANPAAEKIVGVPLVGLSRDQQEKTFRFFHPDKMTPYPPNELPVARAVRGEVPDTEEIFLVHDQKPEGLWLSVSARPIKDEKGSPWGAIAIIRDVTERIHAEKALAQKNTLIHLLQVVASAANEAVSIKEAVQICLDEVCEKTGWPVGHAYMVDAVNADLVSMRLWHLAHATRFDAFRSTSEITRFVAGSGFPGSVLQSGQPEWILNLDAHSSLPRFKTARDGGLRAAFAFPILRQNKVVGVMEFFSDELLAPDALVVDVMRHVGAQLGRVIDRKENEDALRRAHSELELRVLERTVELSKVNAELRRSNQELEQFAVVASHDLQEPLRKIDGFAGLLAQDYLGKIDDKANHLLGGLVKTTERMRSFIKNLLLFARIDRSDLSAKTIEMTQIAQQVKTDLEPTLAETGADITFEALPTVKANPSHMYQLLQNLIGNAVKFRGKNKPAVHISAEKKDGYWIFSIVDNGIGMDAERAEGVFDIFQRLPDGVRAAGGGIGLAICRKIVELHGGRIWVESQLGNGSTFRFSLPTP